MKRATLVLALLLHGLAQAQTGPSEIRIESGAGHFACYAHVCLEYSDREKESRLRNLQNVMENDCNSKYSTQARCDKARGDYAAARECFASYCSSAMCKTKDYNSKQCISRPYFSGR